MSVSVPHDRFLSRIAVSDSRSANLVDRVVQISAAIVLSHHISESVCHPHFTGELQSVERQDCPSAGNQSRFLLEFLDLVQRQRATSERSGAAPEKRSFCLALTRELT
jgi:hypothetical protein